jgi:hypothetical protein
MTRIASTTFFCDVPKCDAGGTVPDHPERELAAGYLDLIDSGWVVQRPPVGSWKHYCPAHARPEDRPS